MAETIQGRSANHWENAAPAGYDARPPNVFRPSKACVRVFGERGRAATRKLRSESRISAEWPIANPVFRAVFRPTRRSQLAILQALHHSVRLKPLVFAFDIEMTGLKVKPPSVVDECQRQHTTNHCSHTGHTLLVLSRIPGGSETWFASTGRSLRTSGNAATVHFLRNFRKSCVSLRHKGI